MSAHHADKRGIADRSFKTHLAKIDDTLPSQLELRERPEKAARFDEGTERTVPSWDLFAAETKPAVGDLAAA
eukprot:1696140-Amphidinium_carterae.1